MPTLNWIGKEAVVNHHREVPYRLLHCDPKQSAGDPQAGNLIVQGDNLKALKALLPYYAGKVKCIYIDPPYNTGNENWVYNDNVNAPQIKDWLGKTVGKEAEDLSRHDKWLCMMYPRLKLLREFLSEDGVIFVSIDDNEVATLRMMLDSIFGGSNFIASVIWQKVYSPKNSARHFSEDHDYIVVYARSAETWTPQLIPRTAEQDKAYKNPDDDPRGPWKTSDLSARNPYSAGTYSIICPSGRVIKAPPKGAYWRFSEKKFIALDQDNRIWWGKNGGSIPQIKRFLSEVKQGRVPQTLWQYGEVGHTQEAKKELVSLIDFDSSADVFITPKPSRLIKRILQIASDPDSLILDSFAGSGTTMHAVMQLNREDGGNRRCIMVEMEEDIATKVTAERVRRVMAKHAEEDQTSRDRQGAGPLPDGRGSASREGFRYCTLGEPLFDADGAIRDHVRYQDLAHHVFFAQTGKPLPPAPGRSKRSGGPFLGVDGEGPDAKAYYLLFNGILGDKSVGGGNVLTRKTLEACAAPGEGFEGQRIIFGEACRLAPETLARLGVVFKQLPYEIEVG